MNRIFKYVILDIVKNRMLIAYTLFLGILSWTIFSLEDNASKGVLSLLNIILLTIPLVSIIFSTIYVYNSSEFIQLLLSQPIKRRKIWISIFGGLCVAFILSFLVGCGLPLLIYNDFDVASIMILVGCLISAVFVSFAMLSAILSKDKAKGIGIAILIWLFFALIFDGLVLFLLFQFADYPIEKMMLPLIAFSPVDVARILILLKMDISALMGYTGAIFKDFLGTSYGMATAISILVFWAVTPFLISLRLFRKKDL